MSWVTTKVALWACAVLGVLFIASGIALWVQGERLEAAKVKAQGLELVVSTTIAANAEYLRTTGELEVKLAHANRENERVKREGDDAVGVAEKAKKEADNILHDFMEKFANRVPTCDQALHAMEAACPALSDY